MKAVLFHKDTGRIQQDYELQLPPPLSPDQATQADWDAALQLLGEASGMGVMFGEMTGSQQVVNGQIVPIDPTLEQLKANKVIDIDNQRDFIERSGFPYLGKIFQSDAVSVMRITIAVQAAQAAMAAGQDFEIVWGAADNTPVPLDAIGMIGMPVALAQHAGELYQIGKDLKALLRSPATDTPEKVAAISWPTS